MGLFAVASDRSLESKPFAWDRLNSAHARMARAPVIQCSSTEKVMVNHFLNQRQATDNETDQEQELGSSHPPGRLSTGISMLRCVHITPPQSSPDGRDD